MSRFSEQLFGVQKTYLVKSQQSIEHKAAISLLELYLSSKQLMAKSILDLNVKVKVSCSVCLK